LTDKTEKNLIDGQKNLNLLVACVAREHAAVAVAFSWRSLYPKEKRAPHRLIDPRTFFFFSKQT